MFHRVAILPAEGGPQSFDSYFAMEHATFLSSAQPGTFFPGNQVVMIYLKGGGGIWFYLDRGKKGSHLFLWWADMMIKKIKNRKQNKVWLQVCFILKARIEIAARLLQKFDNRRESSWWENLELNWFGKVLLSCLLAPLLWKICFNMSKTLYRLLRFIGQWLKDWRGNVRQEGSLQPEHVSGPPPI